MESLKRPFPSDVPLSSSPAFATPLHPIPSTQAPRPPPPPAFKPQIPTILPILLPPPTLRPLAFRTFTKKHNLTLNASALSALAAFIGRHCGSGWREEGTGEKVSEEVAKLWKSENGGVIVEDGGKLQSILRTLEGCMTGGRIAAPVKRGSGSASVSRQNSFAFGNDSAVDLSAHPQRPMLDQRNSSFGLSALRVEEPGQDEDEPEDGVKDPRAWLKVLSAFEQPRFHYDIDKKHFIPACSPATPFPPPSHKTALFKERYNAIHQRILRNEAFQAPSFSRSGGETATQTTFYKLTPIANLLGRGGTSHLLLGQLVVAPTGTLALNDPTGSIYLSLEHATSLQGPDSCFFSPGMIVLIEGVYEEDWSGAGSSGLGNTGGVGGTIGGRFVGFSIGGPPVEKRNASLGVGLGSREVGGGFGWTDFLGLGSERAVGTRMRRLEQRLLSLSDGLIDDDREDRRKMIVLSEVSLDQPSILTGLRKLFQTYSTRSEFPTAWILCGNFISRTALSGTDVDSVAYKEAFNSLAAILSEFPALLKNSTWTFVPGDNDPWASAFSAGASTLIPRDGVPEVFTSRIKRAFAEAKRENTLARRDGEKDGEVIFTSNPAKLSLFGPAHEVMVFRDDICGRFRRSAVRVGQATRQQDQPQPETNGGAEAVPQQDGQDIVMSGALPSVEDIEETQPSPAPEPESAEAETSDSYATQQAKKLILSLLPQSTLSPFPLATRPVHWDYASSALSLYPLPHALILADADIDAFAVTFEGCHCINPGRFLDSQGRKVRWVEYDLLSKRGTVQGLWIG